MEEKKDFSKIYLCIAIVVFLAIGIVCVILNYKKINESMEKLSTTTTTTTKKPVVVEPPVVQNGLVVTSLEDKFSSSAVWCGTFNLIWNDLRDELVKGDIVWLEEPMSDQVKNLNKGTFTTKELADSSYYKIYDHPTPALKTKIESSIWKKFKQKSDILDQFNFEGHGDDDWFLYTMLYKEFKFKKVFDKVGKYPFANSEVEYEYFGIKKGSSEELEQNIKIINYTDDDHFIVELLTKGNDELIIYKGFEEDNFLDAYNKVTTEESKEVHYSFNEGDTFKMPFMKTNIMEEISEVENKNFLFSDGTSYFIEKALQTVKFELNNEGGKIKSEAAMMVDKNAMIVNNKHLDVDDDFILFIREKGSKLPYVAMRVQDMSLYS